MNSTIFMAIVGGIVGCLISLLFYKQAKEKYNVFFYILLLGYIGALIGATLLPLGNYGMKTVETMSLFINIIPFGTNADIMSHSEVIQCGMNIIMFMPLGVLVPLTTRKTMRLKHFIALCFILSLSIEVTQLVCTFLGIMWRSFDVNDIIFNTLGGSFTYAFIYMITKCLIIEKRQAHSLS